MPFGPLSPDIFPKALVGAAVMWGIAHYFVVGPTMASRIVRADHLPVCEADLSNMAAKAGEERARSLKLPSLDPAQEYAAEQTKRFLDSPAMNQLRVLSDGLGEQFGLDMDGAARMALQRAEESRRAATQAYEDALARIEADTAATLADAGGLCGCLGDAAIQESRTEWAIFSGTLSLVRLAPLDQFAERMSEVYRAGGCAGTKAVNP